MVQVKNKNITKKDNFSLTLNSALSLYFFLETLQINKKSSPISKENENPRFQIFQQLRPETILKIGNINCCSF